ncbi:MAG TPA: hypothetical protein VNO14_13125, partial [Blastocatellia bacterium]|nr:hypothetical protein [Blastocatellia bacterium]
SDLDIVPAASLVAGKRCGAIVLCAYEASEIIGFCYAFPAFEGGRVSFHSHMLAVRPGWRNCQAGFYLKLAQRDRALDAGIDEITWTFDPLQSLNAHLNFSKLGVISERYLVNFYGEATSSPLHSGFGTDRLWVRWLLASDRVRERLDLNQKPPAQPLAASPDRHPLLVRAVDERPVLENLDASLNQNVCLIEIPHNIQSLKERNPALAREWREATRTAFLNALDSSFFVQDFLGLPSDKQPRWFYVLHKP